MTQRMNGTTSATASFASAMFPCAAAASIVLAHRTLSLSLGVLLLFVVVLCGILISLALVRRTRGRNRVRS